MKIEHLLIKWRNKVFHTEATLKNALRVGTSINITTTCQTTTRKNKSFNSLPTFIWETRKGEHRFPD